MTVWTGAERGRGGTHRAGRADLPAAARSAAGAVPPTGLILLGITSVQFGSALAKSLFAALPPQGVVAIRLVAAALVLLPFARGRGAVPHGRRDLAVAAALGVAVAGMTLSFYEALDRLPLGIAVTVEFLGPLGVAVAGSRRRLDALWVVLAGGGVVLLARGGGGVTALGVALAALAAVGWAVYILLMAAVGSRFGGTSGLAVAMAVGAVVSLPFGATTVGTEMLSPRALLLGAVVGVLSSVIPYSLEMEALRRIPPKVFGLLMSLEPAVAALIGFAVLRESLTPREWAAIVFVVAACVGATRSGRRESG